MAKKETVAMLASFATLKSISDDSSYRNAYQILAEFIAYIIQSQKLHLFSSDEMKNKLWEEFGFKIPEAVVTTASKQISYVRRANGMFNVDFSQVPSSGVFENTQKASQDSIERIIKEIRSFIEDKKPEESVDDRALEIDLIGFLIDDQQASSGRYSDLVSEYVLVNEHRIDIQSSLEAIREGSVIYIGLNHNISEIGSITKDLTLFLGTEVLFSLVGYNGEIHRRLAEDMFSLVQNANQRQKKVHLRYFREVKKEVDDFFGTAELIVQGKLTSNDTAAMKAILNGCDQVSDVTVKQSDFYHKLKFQFGILEDDEEDYYSPKYHEYNLESMAQMDEQAKNSWRLISHINKRRQGRVYENDIESQFLIVTNTGLTIAASNEQREIVKNGDETKYCCDYAVTVGRITNLLWYKLGKGFGGKGFPSNTKAALRARIVLSASISHNALKVFTSAKQEYRDGKITEEQLAARVMALHAKPVLPEDISADTIEDSLNFSPEFINRFETEFIANRDAIARKNEELLNQQLEHSAQIEKKDQLIADKDSKLEEAQNINKKLQTELEDYRSKERENRRRKEKRRIVLKLIITILVAGLLVGITLWVNHRFNNVIINKVSTFFNVAAVVVALISWGKEIYQKVTTVKKQREDTSQNT